LSFHVLCNVLRNTLSILYFYCSPTDADWVVNFMSKLCTYKLKCHSPSGDSCATNSAAGFHECITYLSVFCIYTTTVIALCQHIVLSQRWCDVPGWSRYEF